MRMFYPLLFTASALGFSVIGGVPLGLTLAYSTLLTSVSYLISQVNFTPVVHLTHQRTRPVFTFITDSWNTFHFSRRFYPSFENYGYSTQVPSQFFRQPSPVPSHSSRRPVASVVTPVSAPSAPPPWQPSPSHKDSDRHLISSTVQQAPPVTNLYNLNRNPVASTTTPVDHSHSGRRLVHSSIKPV